MATYGLKSSSKLQIKFVFIFDLGHNNGVRVDKEIAMSIKNPVPKSGVFATPTLERLVSMVESMNGSDKANAYTIMVMTMNACHQLVEEELAKTDACL